MREGMRQGVAAKPAMLHLTRSQDRQPQTGQHPASNHQSEPRLPFDPHWFVLQQRRPLA